MKTRRFALVTGASSGIGAAMARLAAQEGFDVGLVARRADRLESLATELRAAGAGAEMYVCDLSVPGSAESLAAKVFAQRTCVDMLVNNAGAIPGGSLREIDDAKWRQAWELKLFGYINVVRAMLEQMESRGKGGVIANIIGMAGAAPRNEYLAGSTANAALMAFTNAVGAASVRNGIRVFGINPSPTRSDRMETMMRAQAEKKLGDPARWTELTTNMPFGRLMEPQEVADLTVFCCSPLSGYLSGSVINLDGGQMYASPK